MKKVYAEKMTYSKYDDSHIIGYLNEEVLKNYTVENSGMESEEPQVLKTAYQYEGTESDGGTIMPLEGEPTYGSLTDAIIRSQYSASEENAIHRHKMESMEAGSSLAEDVLAKYDAEWVAYNAFCEKAKTTAKSWLA